MTEDPSWHIVLTRNAERDLTLLSSRDRNRVRAAIDALRTPPWQQDVKKLQGRDNEWRVRVGDWRVRFIVDQGEWIVYILRILRRGRAYQE